MFAVMCGTRTGRCYRYKESLCMNIPDSLTNYGITRILILTELDIAGEFITQ